MSARIIIIEIPTERRRVRRAATRVELAVWINQNWRQNPMALTIRDGESFPVTAKPKDRKGRPATVQAPTWESSAPAVLAVTVAEDGLSATCVAGDAGEARLTFTCDADLSEGVRQLVGTLDVTVLSGEAVTVELDVGSVFPVPM